jgi:lysyl-tRNA synthetase class 2
MRQPEDWRPSASLELIRFRASLLHQLRAWFARRGIIEVETPALSGAAVSDPNLHSLATRVGGHAQYLHTSPEYCMKRLLASGSGDIYQICKVFRDGELGRRHNPEFTMLEWYRIGLGAHEFMDEVESLLSELALGRRALAPARRLSYRALFVEHTGIDPFTCEAAELVVCLERNAVPLPAGMTQDFDGLLDLLLASVIEPALPADAPVFVFDFPPGQAALAQIRNDDPPVAERFELFLGGMELANGFHELADPDEQSRRFQQDLRRRAAAGLPCAPVDQRLLAALEAGLPDCSGAALGFDRLVMWLADCDDIAEVLSFDAGRA